MLKSIAGPISLQGVFVELTSKPFMPIADQIELLASRGIDIPNVDFARQWLDAVGYYRLSGYWFVYRQSTDRSSHLYDKFVPETTFEDVAALYEFDRKLRILILDGIERVEVGFRSKMSHILGELNPLAHEDASLFRANKKWRTSHGRTSKNSFNYLTWKQRILAKVDRSANKNSALIHHIQNRNSVFPIWLLLDFADFSDLSHLFDGLLEPQQKSLLGACGLQVDFKGIGFAERNPFGAWFQQLSLLRNYCAHHCRIWNIHFVAASSARLRRTRGLETLPGQSEKLYGALTMLIHLVEQMSPGSKWRERVRDLIIEDFSALPHRHLREMGFPANWADTHLWQ